MKTNDAFSPVTEKVAPATVSLMSWSPKFDLLAVATATGKLLLFRLLPKEKVWIIAAADSETKILSMTWKPDGKIIAVSYSKNKYGIQLICMETRAKLQKFSLDQNQSASLLNWIELDSTDKNHTFDKETTSADFLPNFPVWNLGSEKRKKKVVEDPKASSFSILYFCDDLCRVFLLANGMFPIMMLDCAAVGNTSSACRGDSASAPASAGGPGARARATGR